MVIRCDEACSLEYWLQYPDRANSGTRRRVNGEIPVLYESEVCEQDAISVMEG